MDTLKLSNLIGLEILELRFHYVPENEFDLQSFHSYLKLTNEIIIDIPHFDDDEYKELTQDNLDHMKKRFDTGQKVKDKVKTLVIGQKITDFYFSYNDNQVDVDNSAFIKLSNNYYLSERNYGPIGLTDIDLIILSELQFKEEVKRLKSIQVDVHSFTKTKNV